VSRRFSPVAVVESADIIGRRGMNNGMPSTERSRGTSTKAQFTYRNTTQCGQAGSKLIGDFAARSDDNVLLDLSARLLSP
jgi:hypothetical protein